ncbi:MAG: hypothetical protein ACRCXN_12920 [Bacteroidales bacterium]
MKKINIDFVDIDSMPFRRFIEWAKSEKGLDEYLLCGLNIESMHLYDASIVSYWLNSLNESIGDRKDGALFLAEPKDIMGKSYRQKLDAVSIIQAKEEAVKSGKNLAVWDIIHYIGACFSYEPSAYVGLSNLEEKACEILDMPTKEAYPLCVGYLQGLQKYEAKLAGDLKQIPYTDQQKRAGAQELEKFGEFLTIRNLAGADITRLDKVLDSDLGTVTRFILIANHESWYNYNLNQNLLESIKQQKRVS